MEKASTHHLSLSFSSFQWVYVTLETAHFRLLKKKSKKDFIFLPFLAFHMRTVLVSFPSPSHPTHTQHPSIILYMFPTSALKGLCMNCLRMEFRGIFIASSRSFFRFKLFANVTCIYTCTSMYNFTQVSIS